MAGATPLRDSLRRLCADVGWSYAVFWRATRATDSQPLQLVWGDGHWERAVGAPAISGFEAMDLLLKEKAAALRSGGGRGGEGHAPEGAAGHAQDRVDALVHKAMVHQVHVVGEGVIGQAALTGAHRWILHDNLDECGEADEVLLEMKDQFCAGIHLFLIHGLDHLLRLASIQTVIHPNIGSLDCRVTLFFLAGLEVIRRGHWNFYRLENEHLNNAGKFRSVKVIPLPFHEVEEDLIVWMRTAALPTFRKLYGRIYVDLKENGTITVRLSNNYNTVRIYVDLKENDTIMLTS